METKMNYNEPDHEAIRNYEDEQKRMIGWIKEEPENEIELSFRQDVAKRIGEFNRKRFAFDRLLQFDEAHLWRKSKSELRPDYRPHRCQWSETVKRAFAVNVFKFIAP